MVEQFRIAKEKENKLEQYYLERSFTFYLFKNLLNKYFDNENGNIIFSPVIVSNVKEQWKNGLLDNYLPYEIGLENTVNSLIEWKRRYEREMVLDIQQIFKDKDVSFVRTNVELHKIDKKGMHPIDLGDYDVLAIDDSRLKIWIVESKVLKKVGSFFEM